MAVPGNVLTGRNRGGHALIRDGAKVVETADDILEEIGLCAVGAASERAEDATEADPVLGHMDAGQSYDLDALAAFSGLNSAELLSKLVDHELRGLVRLSETGQFRRLRG